MGSTGRFLCGLTAAGVLCSALPACTDTEESHSSGVLPQAETTVAGGDTGAGPADTDVVPAPDEGSPVKKDGQSPDQSGAVEDAGPSLPLDFNTPCKTNDDCSTGFCIEGPDGKVCTMSCIVECPVNWDCEGVTNYGADLIYVCVPKFVALCAKCDTHADCGGVEDARCLAIENEGMHCTRKCNLQNPCAPGYLCKPVDDALNLCFPVTGSCICTEALLGQTEECYKESSFGICKGVKTCAGPGGWTPCDAKSPVAEHCDGWDNDCDGDIDENLSGDCVKTNEHGTCKGKNLCKGAAGFVCDAQDPMAEACDNKDNDCDGTTDEPDATGCQTFYEDKDKDGLGNVKSSMCLCKPTGDYVALESGDCHDLNPSIGPGKEEFCNGADDDCNGEIDPEGSKGCTWYFKDGDGDGYGVSGDSKCLCAPYGDYKATVGGDCADNNTAVFTGGVEKCNGVDDNCNGIADEPGALMCKPYLVDADGDGFGVTGLSQCMCGPSGEYTATIGGDCNDKSEDFNPIALEICDGKDNNCNGIPDDDCDKDSDGYCNALKPVVGFPPSCPLGGGDCVDFNAAINPGAKEVCDEVDNDCDGAVDEGVKSPCGGCQPVCLMGAGPKSDEPFQEEGGLFDGAGKDEAGNIVLDTSSIQLNMIWVANSGQGTISKLNTQTGDEVARYNLCNDPSRTAVDSLGNAWIACRGDARVVKVALSQDECVDKNKDGKIQTSTDENGNKVIDGNEMMAKDTDECVLFAVQPDGADAKGRAMGVDKDDNGWVGMWNTSRLWKLSGKDGSVLQKINIPTNPYGLAIDQTGIIWISGRGTSQLVRVDPTTNATAAYKPSSPCSYSPYGITIDENGRIWTANCCCSPHAVHRFDPVTLSWSYAVVTDRPRGIASNGNGYVFVANDESNKVAKINVNTMAVEGWTNLGGGKFPIGMGVDFEGNVWAINHNSSSATRIDPVTMAILFEKPTGPKPYTYSDMTGFQQKTIVAPKGTYRHVFKGWTNAPTKWMQVGLSLTTPPGTHARLRVRAADKLANLETAVWTPYWGPFPPELPTVNLGAFGSVIGQYLEVGVELFSEDSKSTPILKSIDVVSTPL